MSYSQKHKDLSDEILSLMLRYKDYLSPEEFVFELIQWSTVLTLRYSGSRRNALEFIQDSVRYAVEAWDIAEQSVEINKDEMD